MNVRRVCTIFLLFLLCFCILFYNFKQKQIDNICSVSKDNVYDGFINPASCYARMYRKLIPHFLLYDAKVNGVSLKFVKLGKSKYGTYIIPAYAIQKADAVIGYGIEDDISFEEQTSDIYNKSSYGYDCGVKSIPIKNKKCHFKSECIGTDKYILTWENQTSSKHLHPFGKNITKLGLNGKKYFIKMDIAGAEYDVMDDVLKNSNDITGIALVIHMPTVDKILLADKMLEKIEKNFILVERFSHPNPFLKLKNANLSYPETRGTFFENITLSYINKNLVDKYNISWNQNNLKRIPKNEYKQTIYSDIEWPVIIKKKLFIKRTGES